MENNNHVVRKSALAMTAGQLPRGLNFNEDADLEGDANAGQNGTAGQEASRIAALERNQQLMQVISDPDVAAVIALKRAGKTVQVGEKAVEEEVADTEEEAPDILAGIKDDDPHKELLGKIDALINAKLGPMSKKVDKQLGELGQKTQVFESVANDIQRKEVDTQIASAKEKFPDFEKLKPKMLELSKKHPGLNVEQLALIAMNDAGTLKLQRSSTQSEKPTNAPRRPAQGNQTPKTRMGRKGFNEILAEKLGALNLDSSEE